VTIREATAADAPTVLELFVAMGWPRPWPRPEITPAVLEGKLVLVAEEDGEITGFVFGDLAREHKAHVNIACVRTESQQRGVMRALLAEFAARARAAGSEWLTLDVDTNNEVGQKVWERLGFKDYSRRLQTRIDELERRVAASAGAGESRASIHVQTDDAEAVEAAMRKYLPRFGGGSSQVEPPQNGWVTVHAQVIDRDRKARDRLASELSNATAAVVCTLAIEDGRLVRYVLYERGSVVDEYQSVPEYYGPVPPGDVVALGANPSVVARLTGADPARVRVVARTASSPDELPPAAELLAQIAELMGVPS
jgi:ribosomal protein S18 acetylase RimI-like enzyme